MFLGTHTPRLDDKGRLTLPAKYRDELRGGLMITKGQDHCLYVFTRETFEEMARKVASAPLTSESARAFQRADATMPAPGDRRTRTRRAGSRSSPSCAATRG